MNIANRVLKVLEKVVVVYMFTPLSVAQITCRDMYVNNV